MFQEKNYSHKTKSIKTTKNKQSDCSCIKHSPRKITHISQVYKRSLLQNRKKNSITSLSFFASVMMLTAAEYLGRVGFSITRLVSPSKKFDREGLNQNSDTQFLLIDILIVASWWIALMIWTNPKCFHPCPIPVNITWPYFWWKKSCAVLKNEKWWIK